MTGQTIAVVHLIRKSNGLSVFREFFDSYQRHHEGCEHDLVLIFKDFEEGEDEPYLSFLADTKFVRYDFQGDGGLDIGPYFEVAEHLRYDYYCFLNSFSRIECDDWLSKLINALKRAPQAGIVGATGSWESTGSSDPPFPNPHIRSNAFLVPGKRFRDLDVIPVESKDDARVIESGPGSLTRQMTEDDRKAYVVDRHGKYWPQEDWPQSATFRSKGQQGLMISDNRTRAFDEGDDWTREFLYDLAWTGRPSSANPFKRHKFRHRIRRFFQRKRPQR